MDPEAREASHGPPKGARQGAGSTSCRRWHAAQNAQEVIGNEANGNDANEHSDRVLRQIAKGEGPEHDARDGPGHHYPEIG